MGYDDDDDDDDDDGEDDEDDDDDDYDDGDANAVSMCTRADIYFTDVATVLHNGLLKMQL